MIEQPPVPPKPPECRTIRQCGFVDVPRSLEPLQLRGGHVGFVVTMVGYGILTVVVIAAGVFSVWCDL